MKIIFSIIIFLTALNFPLATDTLTMSSTNYQIITDVVSVGGDKATSINYQINNTLGEFGTDSTRSTSTNYIVSTGFQAAAGTVLSATLSTNSIDLGTLSVSAVATASQTLTVTTDSPSGYSTTIVEDGELRSGSNTIPDVGGGAVTAGTAGYGVRTSGSAGKMNSADASIGGAVQQIAASSTPAINETTVITYKAAIGSGTAYGTYSQTVTISTTVNY